MFTGSDTRSHSIASGSLGIVQRTIRRLNQLVDREMSVLGLQRCRADAHGDRNTPRGRFYGCVRDGITDALRDFDRPLEIAPWQHDHEFFASIAAESIVGSQRRREPLRCFHQDRVSDGVSIDIVHLLEMIQIQHEYADGTGMAQSLRSLSLKQIENGASIERSRQYIVGGFDAKLLLQLYDTFACTQARMQLFESAVPADVIVRPCVYPGDDIGCIGLRGEHDDVDVAFVAPLTNSTAQLQAVESRHVAAYDRDAGRIIVLKESARVDAVRCDKYIVTALLEQREEFEPSRFVGFCDKNFQKCPVNKSFAVT